MEQQINVSLSLSLSLSLPLPLSPSLSLPSSLSQTNQLKFFKEIAWNIGKIQSVLAVQEGKKSETDLNKLAKSWGGVLIVNSSLGKGV